VQIKQVHRKVKTVSCKPMDDQLENEIIRIVHRDIEKLGSCSLKHAASSIFYQQITMADQKRLAKKIVKGNPLVTETVNGEIVVKKNLNYSGDPGDSESSYRLIKGIIAIVVAILSYLLFEVFLPGLHH